MNLSFIRVTICLATILGAGTVMAQQHPMRIAANLDWPTDWSTALPFVDVLTNTREWAVISADAPLDYPHGFNGVIPDSVKFDDDGYPVEIPQAGLRVCTVTMTDLRREAYPSGRYTLIFEGTGEVHLGWDAGNIHVKGNGGVTKFEFQCGYKGGGNSAILLSILKSDRADHIRNMHLILPGFADTWKEHRFNPKFLEDIRPFCCLRFMDWGSTNGSQQVSWDKRTRPGQFAMMGASGRAAPYEYMIELGNVTHKDIWINVPAMADEDYCRQLAQLVAANLKPGLKCYVEWSNETWNAIFSQHGYSESHGGHVANAVKVFKAFDDAFKNDHSRYVKVLASFIMLPNLTQQMVDQLKDSGINPNGVKADAVAVAPYIGHEADGNVDQVLDAIKNAIPGVASLCAQHRAICNSAGLDLINYEGGTHALHGAIVEANADPRMYAIYNDYLNALAPSVSMFNQYVAVSGWGAWGCWGAKQYVGEPMQREPKYRALYDYVKNQGTMPGADYLKN